MTDTPSNTKIGFGAIVLHLSGWSLHGIRGCTTLRLIVWKYSSFSLMVSVAQSVEHWIVAPVVAGSIPVTHPSLFSFNIEAQWFKERLLSFF